MRPGPYKVAAATASLLLKVWPAPLTKAAMVNPSAKPDANGKLAAKEDFPATVLTFEIGTVTGRFAPERYAIELAAELTTPGTANCSVIFFACGVVTTVRGPNVVRLTLDSG